LAKIKMRTMKKSFIPVILIIVLFNSCASEDLPAEISSCMEDKINELKRNASPEPKQLWRWTVDNKTYYHVISDCCDFYNYLYDSNCRAVCAPDGGFSGAGDGQCPSFDSPIEKVLLWEDDRD
jgi:hypothetical protein